MIKSDNKENWEKENFENFKVLNLEKALKSEKYGVWIDANFGKNKKKNREKFYRENGSDTKLKKLLNLYCSYLYRD